MVAVFALIGQPLLQPSGQVLPLTTLRLRETLRGVTQFVRVGNFFASRKRQEVQKTWVNTNFRCVQRWNAVRLCVDAQTQIPARGALDDTATLQPSSGDVLLVEA